MCIASDILHHLGIRHLSQLYDDVHRLNRQDPVTIGMSILSPPLANATSLIPFRSTSIGQKYSRKPYSELQA